MGEGRPGGVPGPDAIPGTLPQRVINRSGLFCCSQWSPGGPRFYPGHSPPCSSPGPGALWTPLSGTICKGPSSTGRLRPWSPLCKGKAAGRRQDSASPGSTPHPASLCPPPCAPFPSRPSARVGSRLGLETQTSRDLGLAGSGFPVGARRRMGAAHAPEAEERGSQEEQVTLGSLRERGLVPPSAHLVASVWGMPGADLLPRCSRHLRATGGAGPSPVISPQCGRGQACGEREGPGRTQGLTVPSTPRLGRLPPTDQPSISSSGRQSIGPGPCQSAGTHGA